MQKGMNYKIATYSIRVWATCFLVAPFFVTVYLACKEPNNLDLLKTLGGSVIIYLIFVIAEILLSSVIWILLLTILYILTAFYFDDKMMTKIACCTSVSLAVITFYCLSLFLNNVSIEFCLFAFVHCACISWASLYFRHLLTT